MPTHKHPQTPTNLPTSPKCPRCGGCGQALWVQPGGKRLMIRCSCCAGTGVIHDTNSPAYRAELREQDKSAKRGMVEKLKSFFNEECA